MNADNVTIDEYVKQVQRVNDEGLSLGFSKRKDTEYSCRIFVSVFSFGVSIVSESFAEMLRIFMSLPVTELMVESSRRESLIVRCERGEFSYDSTAKVKREKEHIDSMEGVIRSLQDESST